ncbi:type I polyketide synthase [Actinomycetospora sp. NBRC 106378]|uniref:type I polyketide synthase n=1 Tax=Actinomycetospora sp. NBRC 106378 TaxID=3032208 RepID=UPI0024A0A1E0|nr:type I polyketide synthase [Actinomycetospora sp. NBRC 106378]GLZ53138.1 hypothetical protein Acsp07_27550 [Actinomycetospora sp. NBRC 106378]
MPESRNGAQESQESQESPDRVVEYLRRVTADLRRAKARIAELESRDGEPVAIVGMGCRLPGGVDSPESLWDLVERGGDAVSTFPVDRGWDLEALRTASATGHGGFLDDAARFDAPFFGVSPREAAAMDPQQRLLLEVSWEALERAGIPPTALRGTAAGVFVGSYSWGAPSAGAGPELSGHALTGTAASVLSGRLAYTLGLEGPAVTVDTACSSSLVALHLAAHSLRTGESSLAVVGGVTILRDAAAFVEFTAQGGLAPDGRCKAFSDAADGTGWAEGVGVLVAERLSDAVAHGHPVLAVLRGSAVNQDGASDGLTAPNGPAQERVIRQALAAAGLTGGDVDVVEAHGTGTRLGDPIEAQALLATYGRDRAADRPLWLGSLKSNIGHTQAAAGVAGVIKMVMALRHGVLPRTLHAGEPTAHVDWSAGSVRLLGEPVAWPAGERVRRAAVSSFGISGTNAHAVLEQAPDPAPVPAAATDDVPAGPVPWVISGHTEPALRAQAAALHAALDGAGDGTGDGAGDGAGTPHPRDVAHALLATRARHEHRAVVVGEDPAELLAGVAAVATGRPSPVVVRGAADVAGRVVFVFPGQGAQWVGMGARLLDEDPGFAASIDACAAALAEFTDVPLVEVLRDPDPAALDRVDVVQPASFAVMVALAEHWRRRGLEPDAVLGHSQGEIAAAVVAGALSLRDGARVVALRSRAIAGSLAGRGGMMSVALPVADVDARLAGRAGVSVAAVNGPRAVVVAGATEALDSLAAELATQEVRVRRIAVDYASHSEQVEDLRAELLDVLAPVAPRAATVPMLSTVTGEWLSGPELDGGYWFDNLRGRVRFGDAVTTLLAQGHRAFVEVSAHPVLAMAVQDAIDAAGVPGVAVGTLRRCHGGSARLQLAAAELAVRGVEVGWDDALPGPGAPVALPTYAFQHEHYWPSPAPAPAADTAAPADDEFWSAVDRADLPTLRDALGTDAESAAAILPGLTAWRRARADRASVEAWRYRVGWTPVTRTRPAAPTGPWLVVAGTDAGTGPAGATDAVVAALARSGVDVDTLLLDGTEDADRAHLADRLLAAGADRVTGIVSMLAEAEEDDRAAPGATRGLALSVALVQALGDAGIGAPLWFLTRGALAATPAETLTAPRQALVLGLGWTAAVEHPERVGGTVDLPAELDERSLGRLAGVLAGGTDGEDQLALRPSGVLARRILRAPTTAGPASRTWSPRGTTLVTGGSGTLAPDLTRWLAEQGAEHVVLVSRRGPDAPGAADLVAEFAGSPTEVTVAACDVADRADVAALLDGLRADGRTVRTAIHTAAVIELAAIADTTVAEVAEVVRAKVTGAEILDELLDDDELDAFVLYSSTAGMWGSGIHAAYAAGNAYLSALAHARRARGAAATSVHWGKWPDEAERALADPHQIRRSGLEYLDPPLALAALRRVLDDDETVLGLMDIDWDVYHDVFTAGRPSRLFDDVPEVRRRLTPASPDAVAAPADGLAGRLAGLGDAEARRLVRDLVRAEAAAVLGHDGADAVGEHRAFRDAGFDSVTAVALRTRLAAVTGLVLPSTLVFDHPSPAALADHLRELVGGPGPAAAGPVPAPVAAADPDEPVAVVGMACRYPGGVSTPEELLALALDGVDAISAFPTDRGWDTAGLYDPDPDREGRTYAREGGFLHDAAQFDPAFFGISPREAVAMDPQQRLLLETTWEALERAGIDPAALRGTAAGTFFGATYADYAEVARTGGAGTESHMVTGTAASVLSGRVSYLFGLEGPAVTIDTACSSSLVAMHLACQSLRSGESSLALAGGAAIMSTPQAFIGFARQRALATDGRCKPFSDAADGMTLAEGVGVLALERLSDARRHGHRVLAVIRGSAVNQDGASNGLTAPNGPAQQRVIRQALAHAGLEGGDVDVVEAHGTGTALGDPIEAQALLATYGRDRDEPLLLGSVKSVIGHTQAAAGVAGVITMIGAMRGGRLPATLHLDTPSTHVDWSSGAVSLLHEGRDWPATGDRPRRAGVSSFGISGTNAHLVLEAAPADEPLEEPRPDDGRPVAWPLAAASPAALRDQAARLAAALATTPDLGPAAVGHALATTRAAFGHRAVVVGRDRAALLDGLTAVTGGQPDAGVVRGVAEAAPAGPVLVFPGQGAQWRGMGRELLDTSPVFAAAVDDCAAALAPHVDWSLTAVLRGEVDPALADRVDVVQPALFAMMVSLARLWRSHGVEPAAVVGHSQGEIAAAHVAGALSLSDAALVVARRSLLLPRLSGAGGMVSVAAPAARVAELIGPFDGAISVAAVNGPSSVVVSGDAAALDELLVVAPAAGVRARRVQVDYASHSRHVDTLRDELDRVLAPIRPQAPTVPFFSTVTGARLDGAALDAGYWFTNLRGTVRLQDATEALLEAGHRVFVEISPHPVLTAPVQETQEAHAAAADGAPAVVLGTLRRDDGGPVRVLTALAEAHVHGATVDWSTTVPAAGRFVDLPTYPFQRRAYWPDPAPAPTAAGSGDPTEAAFWDLVESQDLAGLADTLGVPADADAGPLGAVLPALSAWRSAARARWRVGELCHRVTWTPVTPGPPAAGGTRLVLVPAARAEDGWVRAVLDALGPDVVRCDVGSAIDTGRAALAARLADVAAATDLAAVVSLLALDDAPRPELGGTPVGLARTLVALQALGDAGVDAPLWCVTRTAVAAADDDPVTDPAGGAVWGLGRVAALEHPDRWGGLVDLPDELDDRLLTSLRAVLAGPAGEDQLAVRRRGVLARRLEHARPGTEPGTTPEPRPATGPRSVRMGWGTVLVTGGTGGIGGRVARSLAERGARHLLLTSRRGEDAPGAAALRAELEALGARVTIAACDVADRGAVAATLAAVPAELPLTAVVHAAGVADGDAPAAGLSLPALDALLAAKIAAARHLDELTEGADLEAFVLFSSGAATWGSGGQAGYSAANAYLDALAARRRADGRTATSIAWGTFGEVGMAADPAVHERLHRQGVLAMPPQDAVDALWTAVDADETAVTVTRMDWDVFAPAFTAVRPSPLLTTIPEAVAALAADADPATETTDEVPALRRTLEGLPAAQRRRALVDAVRAEAGAVLGHEARDAVPAGRAFRDVGFDSVTAVELRNRLRAALGLALPAALVFDHPTPTALAAHLGTLLFGDAEAPDEHADDPDAAVRAVIASVPVGALRRAGLLDLVLRLADTGTGAGTADPARDEPAPTGGTDSLDDLDAAALLRLATETSAN